ncbi:hypothetical protein, partial [Streptosporangium sp. NPDC002721]|uniref:hypothetical protein n=1 Tax=Streptosporangium sp. NPDC002721 TaxID=3366188 RepID=UPI0036A0355B
MRWVKAGPKVGLLRKRGCSFGGVSIERSTFSECFSSSGGVSDTVVLKDGDGLAEMAGLGRAA